MLRSYWRELYAKVFFNLNDVNLLVRTTRYKNLFYPSAVILLLQATCWKYSFYPNADLIAMSYTAQIIVLPKSSDLISARYKLTAADFCFNPRAVILLVRATYR